MLTLSLAETGSSPGVCSACKRLLKPPYRSSSVLRPPLHGCVQLHSACSPATDYMPDDSCLLKVLQTTRTALHHQVIRSTKKDQRELWHLRNRQTFPCMHLLKQIYEEEIDLLDSQTHIYTLVPLYLIGFLSGKGKFRRKKNSLIFYPRRFLFFSVKYCKNNVGYSTGMLSQLWIWKLI